MDRLPIRTSSRREREERGLSRFTTNTAIPTLGEYPSAVPDSKRLADIPAVIFISLESLVQEEPLGYHLSLSLSFSPGSLCRLRGSKKFRRSLNIRKGFLSPSAEKSTSRPINTFKHSENAEKPCHDITLVNSRRRIGALKQKS